MHVPKLLYYNVSWQIQAEFEIYLSRGFKQVKQSFLVVPLHNAQVWSHLKTGVGDPDFEWTSKPLKPQLSSVKVILRENICFWWANSKYIGTIFPVDD